MKIEVKVCPLLTQGKNDSCVLMSPQMLDSLNLKPGKTLSLTSKSGTKVNVIVVDSKRNQPHATLVSLSVFNKLSSTPSKMTVGCDPEFVFVNSSSKVIPANIWLPKDGYLGNDGPLGELRPPPGTHEGQVVHNLRVLIKMLPFFTQLKFGNNSNIHPEGHSCIENYALGFHIHMGMPKSVISFAAPNSKEFIESLITTLDFFVGIPSMLMEDTDTRRLGTGSYGKPGDWRISQQTLEYRTPGGFHLRHPHFAAGIIAIALCVSKEIVETTETLSNNWKNLDKYSSYSRMQERFSLPSRKDIRWALMEPSKLTAVSYLTSLVTQIQTLKYFKDHEESIINYFQLLNKSKQFNPNLLHHW